MNSIEKYLIILLTIYVIVYIWIFIRSINFLRILFIFLIFGFLYTMMNYIMKEAKREEDEEKRIKEESKKSYFIFDKDIEFIYTIV
jgi:hypothetical protein